MTSVPSATTMPLYAVRVELPAFDSTDVDTWLVMSDNLMADAGITVQSTMFRKVLAKLPPQHFRLVKHLAVASPLPTDSYDQLKACLRRRLQLTPAVKLQRLEQLPPCTGDRAPSKLFADLDALYPKDNEHEIIREHFLRRLPSALQLLCREWLSHHSLTEVALRAVEHFAAHPAHSVAAVEAETVVGSVTDDVSVYRVSNKVNRGAASGRGSGSRGAGNSRRRADFVDRLCRLHRRFGPAARNCFSPCSFVSYMSSGNTMSNRQ